MDRRQLIALALNGAALGGLAAAGAAHASADGALMERARLSQPRLSAAYNEIARIAAERLLPDAPPNVEWLAVALQHATDAILGRPGAKLLLGTVMAA